MTSKERVKRAFARQVPDVLPIGEFAVDFDTVEKVIGRETFFRNKARTQLGYWENRRDEVVDSWKKDAVEVYRKLDLDIAVAWLVPPKDAKFVNPKKLDETTYEFADGKVVKYSDVTVDFSTVHDPGAAVLPAPESFERDDFSYYDESCFEMLDYLWRELGDEKYILLQWGEEEATFALFPNYEQGLINMIEHPDLVKKAIDYKTRQGAFRDNQLKNYPIDGILLGGYDFAHTGGPFISPRMFRDMSLPSAKARTASLKSLGYQVIKHSCGNNWELLDQFVEAGYDCYQSIQPSASMDIRKVKAQYGGKFALWGGVAVEHLVSGSPDDVKNDIDYAVKYAAPNGGFVLGASHSIAVGTKYENYMAMLAHYHQVKACYS